MEKENIIDTPSTGASVGFALGFWLTYVAIVLAVLALFFKLPF